MRCSAIRNSNFAGLRWHRSHRLSTGQSGHSQDPIVQRIAHPTDRLRPANRYRPRPELGAPKSGGDSQIGLYRASARVWRTSGRSGVTMPIYASAGRLNNWSQRTVSRQKLPEFDAATDSSSASRGCGPTKCIRHLSHRRWTLETLGAMSDTPIQAARMGSLIPRTQPRTGAASPLHET